MAHTKRVINLCRLPVVESTLHTRHRPEIFSFASSTAQADLKRPASIQARVAAVTDGPAQAGCADRSGSRFAAQELEQHKHAADCLAAGA